MKNWKTTTAGILAVAVVIVENFFPEYRDMLMKIAAIAAGAGLIAAKDAMPKA